MFKRKKKITILIGSERMFLKMPTLVHEKKKLSLIFEKNFLEFNFSKTISSHGQGWTFQAKGGLSKMPRQG